MKRYDPAEDPEWGVGMHEVRTGDWVRYDDVQAERLLLAEAVLTRKGSFDRALEAVNLAKRIVEGGATETCCICGKQFPKHEMMNNKPICRECY